MPAHALGLWGLLARVIITPITFLGGTFFPLEHLPLWGQKLTGGLFFLFALLSVNQANE